VALVAPSPRSSCTKPVRAAPQPLVSALTSVLSVLLVSGKWGFGKMKSPIPAMVALGAVGFLVTSGISNAVFATKKGAVSEAPAHGHGFVHRCSLTVADCFLFAAQRW
jgi:hypothetical protein